MRAATYATLAVWCASASATPDDPDGVSQKCLRFTTYDDWRDSRLIECAWDFAESQPVDTVCMSLSAEACATHPECTSWHDPISLFACGPSLPNLACRLKTKEECTDAEERHYCKWQDGRGGGTAAHEGCVSASLAACAHLATRDACAAEGCRWDAPTAECRSPYHCEMIASEADCTAAGCEWDLYPMSPFAYCTPAARTCTGYLEKQHKCVDAAL